MRAAEAPVSAEWLLLLVLVAVFVWRGLLPGWRNLSTDFPNYYLAAHVYRQGYAPGRLNDWTWFQRQKDHAGIEKRLVGFVPLTYLSVLPMLPLSHLPPLEAKRIWLVFNLLLLGFTIELLRRMTSLGWRRIALLAFLTVDPLRANFLYGQEYALLLLVLTVATWFYFRGWPAASGATLALGAGLKIYPALFFIFFLRKRQWRGVAGLALGGVVVAALSLLLFGFQANWVYLTQVLPWALRGEMIDPYSVHFNSVTALLHRLFIAEPELNPHPFFFGPRLYAVVQPLCQALLFIPFLWLLGASRPEAAREKLEWGCYVFLLLLLSTHSASYHLCVLILAVALIADSLVAQGKPRELGALVCLYLLAGLPLFRWLDRFSSGGWTFLAFPRLYAMLGLWAFLLWQLSRPYAGRLCQRLRTREGYAFGAIFLALVAAGVALNFLRLPGLYQNYALRVATVPGSLLASEPAAAGHALLFTTMGPHTYRTAALTGGTIRYGDFGADAFHPTFSAESREGFVELAGTASRIIRFSLDGLGFPAGPPAVVVESGEKPTVSPDGRWLLFIREDRGRGSLWIKGLHPDAEHAHLLNREWQWVPSDYDVLEATVFPDDLVVFAARPEGQSNLFMGRILQLRFIAAPPRGGPVRYPAASPDGQWLAYCMEEKGDWQLWITRMFKSTEAMPEIVEARRLTNAECNCTHPAWLPDSKTLIYATDCGRGLGLTALAQIKMTP